MTTGAAGGVPAASDNVVGILQWQGRQEQGKEQQSEQELTSQMTLHLMQRQFQIFPFWFERQGGEYAKERTADGEGRATELDGKMVQTDTVMAEEIKAVYAETWGDGDGQVDGMDLLLTLCAVPGACSFESTPAPQNIDEVNCGNDGEQPRSYHFREARASEIVGLVFERIMSYKCLSNGRQTVQMFCSEASSIPCVISRALGTFWQ